MEFNNFKMQDVRIDSYSNNSAVRVTHIPSGKYSEASNTPSQFKNKQMALAMLEQLLGWDSNVTKN